MPSLQGLDYLVIAGYFLILITVGTFFSHYIHQSHDYFTIGFLL